jgi:hypothetical protein
MYDGNQRSKQYAFVTYEHNEATVRALNDRSMVIDGRLVDVRPKPSVCHHSDATFQLLHSQKCFTSLLHDSYSINIEI